MVNVALAEGELDVNSFQHKPYLEQFKKDKNLDLVDIANTVTFPMGIYSNKIKDLKQLKKGRWGFFYYFFEARTATRFEKTRWRS